MLLAIFDPSYELLGEVVMYDGAFRQVMLLPTGEVRLGTYFSLWQSTGVPARKEVDMNHDHTRDLAFVIERVPFHSKACHHALREWLHEQGLIALDVQDVYSDCWHRLTQLPLNATERYVYGAALLGATRESIAIWREALEDAWNLFIREQGKANQAMEKLKRTLGTELVKKTRVSSQSRT